ncbi:cytochrome P450 family protein [Xylaria venustula]|nr:cytochrome P450 family protein [Xylaria venustula]
MYAQLPQAFPATVSILAIVTAGACIYIVYQSVFSPLASFPGPLAAKLSKVWRAYGMYKGTWHRDIVELHRKYGPVVRIGPNELSVADPEAFRQIYSVSKTFRKSASYAVAQGSRPFDLVNERNEKKHGAQRKLVARPYSMDSTKRFEPAIDVLLDSLLHKLDDFAKSSQVFDLGFWVQLYAFDVIGTVSFNKPFGFLFSGSDNGLFERLQRAMNSFAWVMHAGWFLSLHQNLIMPIFGNQLAANDRNGYFFEFAKHEVEKRKDQQREGILGQLLQAQALKGQPNDLDITFMMTSNVFAGSDTTATAMQAVFLNLLRSPRVLAKLRTDLEARGTGSSNGRVSSAEAEASPYLQAVIYEGMRINPSVPLVLDRDVPPEGMTIGDRFIPGGTVVGTSPWVIHRVKEVWGPDAEQFRPERWLEEKGNGELKRFFFAFGAGTRTCIGRHISWLEIEKLIASLVMRYDFKFADDAKITERSGALVILRGFRVQITRRESR